MDPERWKKVKAVFNAVLDEPGSRRDALAQACSGDADLEHEVAALLAAHEKADGFIETPAALGDLAEAWELEAQDTHGDAGGSETSKSGWWIEVAVQNEGRELLRDAFAPPITIGALPECHVVLQHPRVSGHHATVRVSQRRVLLRDHSSNGTFVDGQRVRDAELNNGARVEIPPFELGFVLREGETARQTDVIAPDPEPPRQNLPERPLDSADLVVVEPPTFYPRRFQLERKVLKLGRGRLADLRLEVSSLSRLHAELVPGAEDWAIRDLDSFNGTYVNGRRLVPGAEQPLHRGDRVRLGEVVLRLGSSEDPTHSELEGGDDGATW